MSVSAPGKTSWKRLDPAGVAAGGGPMLAALVAAVVSLPGLWLPFLADDWINLAVVADKVPFRTPFGYFRPVYLASIWLDEKLWGLSSALFHLTNLLLISASAALVVLVIRRYIGNGWLAAVAGVFFACHPYHVENAAWIAARSDPLFAVFFMLALLAYDRWRERLRGVPVGALILFLAALMTKEAAVALPGVLLVIGLLDRGRRPEGREWRRGYLPMAALGVVHFLWIRPWALSQSGFTLPPSFGVYGIQKLVSFMSATVLPAHTEILEVRPFFWMGWAALVIGFLCLGAFAGSGRIPGAAWAFGGIFLILLAPSLLSFQERYLFLPSAASAGALAVLVCAGGRRVGSAMAALLLLGWMVSIGDHWMGWRQAGSVSRRLVEDLVEASQEPGTGELVVANMPHRVRGAPVAAHFESAVILSGGRRMPIHPATYIDYATASSDSLDGPPEQAIERSPPGAEVRLRVVEERYSRCVLPDRSMGGGRHEAGHARVTFEEEGKILVRIPPAPEQGRAAYVWYEGGLHRLF